MADQPGFLARSSQVDLDAALARIELPLYVWDSERVCLANAAWAEVIGLPLDTLIGQSIHEVAQLFEPAGAFEETVALLLNSTVEATRSYRVLNAPGRPGLAVWLSSRMIELDGRRTGLTLILPVTELARSGGDPAALWQQLSDIAVGLAGQDWIVRQVSADIRAILDTDATNLIGSSLLDWMRPEDRPVLADSRPGAPVGVRFRRSTGSWTRVSVLWVDEPADAQRRFFAVVPVEPRLPPDTDRVSELEFRLRRIGAEVQAAGLLDDLRALPALTRMPQFAQLSTRQWDILTRLVAGESPRAIGEALFLSPSTVRGHLSAIYRRFGVHSQVELLRLLHSS